MWLIVLCCLQNLLKYLGPNIQRGISGIGCSWVTAKIDFSQGKKELLFAWDFPHCLKVLPPTLWTLSRITSGCPDCVELAARRKDPLSLSNPLDCGVRQTLEAWRGTRRDRAQSWKPAQLITTPSLKLNCTDTHTCCISQSWLGWDVPGTQAFTVMWFRLQFKGRELWCEVSQVLIWSWPDSFCLYLFFNFIFQGFFDCISHTTTACRGPFCEYYHIRVQLHTSDLPGHVWSNVY